jgi:threonylcarbamoyladenosine tRNA methylthiotransferase MtaB
VKRVAFCTFGCKLNQYDTEAMRTLLEEEGGWRSVSLTEEADVYVVNTCSVTAKADARARAMIRRLHAERPQARIVAAGCYAQRAPEEIARITGVSLVLGAADRERVAQEIACVAPGEPARLAVSPIEAARGFAEVGISSLTDHSRAFVKIQEGCDAACAFCIIPATRGRPRSRRPQDVLAEVRTLLAAGYAEVVLTGVHLGNYGLDLERRRLLPELVRKILAEPGLARFRLSSLQPETVSDELIDLMAERPEFARHWHIPLQSGSDAVLGRMGRPYASADFVRLLERIAAAIPDCGIGTDVICGFPGESEADFRTTCDVLTALPITYLHAFTFSARPGSAAAGFSDQVPGEIRKERTRELKRLGRSKNRAFRERHLRRTVSVFVENASTEPGKPPGGLTDNYLRVEIDAPSVAGPLTDVHVTDLTRDGLRGLPVRES